MSDNFVQEPTLIKSQECILPACCHSLQRLLKLISVELTVKRKEFGSEKRQRYDFTCKLQVKRLEATHIYSTLCLQTLTVTHTHTYACAGWGGSMFLWIQAKTSYGNRVAVHTHAGRQSLRLGTSSTMRDCQPEAWGRHWEPSHSHQEIRLEPRVECSRGITHFCKHCSPTINTVYAVWLLQCCLKLNYEAVIVKTLILKPVLLWWRVPSLCWNLHDSRFCLQCYITLTSTNHYCIICKILLII